MQTAIVASAHAMIQSGVLVLLGGIELEFLVMRVPTPAG